ncbi:hydantoinase/oxoprolinase family protein, partial [Paracoccus versutus]
GMSRVLIPRTPGVLCALGLLMTDLRSDFSATSLMRLDQATPEQVQAIFDDLRARARAWFEAEGIAHPARVLNLAVDVRYAGQNYEIAVALPDGPVDAATFDTIREGFLAAHRQLYGFVAEGEPMQLVTFRAAASGLVQKADFVPQPLEGDDA